jgi:periplasmic protein TonB
MELKKNPQADLEKNKSVFIQIGLVVSLALTLIAFEWKSYEGVVKQFGPLEIDLSEEEIIPITKETPPPPPPPPPVIVELNIVEDDKEIEDEVVINSEADEKTIVEFVPQEEEVIKEVEIFTIVEDMPEFPGGEAELFKYLGKSIKYPQMAKEAGIQGVVYVTFIIGPDGTVSNVEVLRGIKGGCDEEAVRVVKSMPKWKPGKQRGKPVTVQYNLPIRFVLK